MSMTEVVEETVVTETAPESVVEPAVETPVDTAPAGGESATVTDDRPRDEHGRFIAKGESTTPETPPTAGEAIQSGTEPLASTTPTAPAAATAPAAQGTPYTFKVEGTEYSVQGATVAPNGDIHIPASVAPQVMRAIQEGTYKMLHWESHLEQEREKAREDGKAHATKLTDQMLGLADLAASDDPNEWAKIIKWFRDFKGNLPVLMAKQEAAEYKARLEKLESGKTKAAEQATAEQRTQERTRQLNQEIATLRKTTPEWSILTDTDWKAVERFAAEYQSALVVEKEDGAYLDMDKLTLFVNDRIAIRKEQAEAAKKFTEAARFNQSRNTGTPVPATVGGKPSAPAPTERPKFKDGDDYKSWAGIG
jgi:hypothetical protein